ncbi:MAG TPA: hypothetical protein VGL55_05880 [Steroidobacteraceae bacterium]
MSLADNVISLYQDRGATAYFGERVSMTEHGLQSAFFAAQADAPPELVLAALLHDIGHLLEAVPDFEQWTADAHHEELGSRWLTRHFGAGVTEPIRLHVAAKRYLCATDADYATLLSPASVVTLRLQGGPMSRADIAQFESQPAFRNAVRIRRWDDQGKVAGLKTPGLVDYRDLIESLAVRNT